jgi:hypothetical protein
MANIFGANIGQNYKGILNLNTLNGNLSGTLQAVTDGDGNASVLQLSTASVSFGGSTGLNWDNANTRLGIGTNTPLGILHLKTAAAATRLLLDGDAAQNKIITYRTAGVQRFGLYTNNTAESGSNAGSDFAIRAYSDAGTLLSTPIFIKRSTGFVGIGTTSPSAPLQINDSTKNLAFAVNNAFNFANISTNGLLLNFEVNSVNALRVLDTGTQIGITSGGVVARLHVKGSTTSSGTTSLLVQNSAGSNALQIRDDRVIIMAGLPTSAAGLPAGALWNNLGILNIA